MGWQIFSFLQSYAFSLYRYESLHFIKKKQRIAAILIVAEMFSETANNRVCWFAQKYDMLNVSKL